MDDKFYDAAFLSNTLVLTESQIDDLDSWSCYNEDLINEEVGDLRATFEEVKHRIMKKVEAHKLQIPEPKDEDGSEEWKEQSISGQQ